MACLVIISENPVQALINGYESASVSGILPTGCVGTRTRQRQTCGVTFPFPLQATNKVQVVCVAKGEIELNMIRKREYEVYDLEQEKCIQVERKGEHKADIIIRCKRCNQFLLGYDLVYDDKKLIMENITLPPCRCTRVIRFKKYTEGILRRQAMGNVVRV